MAHRHQQGWLKKEKRSQGKTWMLFFRTVRKSDGKCLGSAGNGEVAFFVSVDSAPSGRGFSRHWGSIVR